MMMKWWWDMWAHSQSRQGPHHPSCWDRLSGPSGSAACSQWTHPIWDKEQVHTKTTSVHWNQIQEPQFFVGYTKKLRLALAPTYVNGVWAYTVCTIEKEREPPTLATYYTNWAATVLNARLTILLMSVGEGVFLSAWHCITWARISIWSCWSVSLLATTSPLRRAAITPRWSMDVRRRLCSLLLLLNERTWEKGTCKQYKYHTHMHDRQEFSPKI